MPWELAKNQGQVYGLATTWLEAAKPVDALAL